MSVFSHPEHLLVDPLPILAVEESDLTNDLAPHSMEEILMLRRGRGCPRNPFQRSGQRSRAVRYQSSPKRPIPDD